MEDKDKKIVSLHLKLMPYLEKYGILLLLVIMILVMHILQPDVFLSWRNVTNVFKQISWQSMLANIDCQDICLKTLVTFLQDKKTSGCNMCITKIIITNKRRIPYFSKYGISFK